MNFINAFVTNTALARLEQVVSMPFKRIIYTEAVEVLQAAVREKRSSSASRWSTPPECPCPTPPEVEWGIDLASEHERYLTEEVYRQPVIVYKYPKDIKAFYMRLNDDNKTVAAMDVLVPRVGELIGGSQREDRLEVLEQRITAQGMPLEAYSAYLDLRKYGGVPHAGFGLGFERLILFATGLENIREVIPFPRWPGNAGF